METTQTQQERAEKLVDALDLPFSNDELICPNCGYWAVSDQGYAYHVKLCAIPA